MSQPDQIPHMPRRLLLAHAFQTPYERLLSGSDTYCDDSRTTAEVKAADFVAQIGIEVAPEAVVVERGAPESLLWHSVRDRDVGCLVVGPSSSADAPEGSD